MTKDQKNKTIIIFVYSIITFLFVGVFTFSKSCRAQGIWVSMDERKKIWDDIAGKNNYQVSKDGLEATFYQDGASWTIIGANAPIVNSTVYPKEWPVKGDNFEIEVINDPIKNYKILPFSEDITGSIKLDEISVTAATDSYATASFVIRSGDFDLNDLKVEATDLKAEINNKNGKVKEAVLSKENIDLRIVKCWYQAGIQLNDLTHKLLTPELLVHDDNLVRVDYKNQVNLIKNRNKIIDSEIIKPLDIPKHQNKQIWITIHIKGNLMPSQYIGEIKISNQAYRKHLKLYLVALPFKLPDPILSYGLYYDGRLNNFEHIFINLSSKTEGQLKSDLNDMKEHGIQNVTIRHGFNENSNNWNKDWEILRKTLKIVEECGFSKKQLLYLDWKYSSKSSANIVDISNNLELYGEKIKNILRISKQNGFEKVYIYGIDEATNEKLNKADKTLYKKVHEVGGYNFVAGQIDQLLKFTTNLDMFVVAGPINKEKIDQIQEAKKSGKIVYIYGNPQAGLEDPNIYRLNYGFNLILTGADGVLDYNYQTPSDCWNDFPNAGGYRPHVMAYSTLEKPIATIQWEGWRKGVNDVRYLTVLYNQGIGITELKGLISSSNDPDYLRGIIINKILIKQQID